MENLSEPMQYLVVFGVFYVVGAIGWASLWLSSMRRWRSAGVSADHPKRLLALTPVWPLAVCWCVAFGVDSVGGSSAEVK